ncbi:PucR family transcriptional regulator ligand-binding domain-containing protein [Paenibacillus sp. P96]|uniref:PucR family transcriptional regulator ligand-binding domain-containing protein n=1 Tax=Paenibacillus zeirhizosphaerae TaxID=2987519 RepID=A0ABT9FX27_9BACL|nr:PucR family transcriptional regulator [Paenibacillus sp. P96]MDP4099291.1 PucR family transcriptional regulator ligand-binding domain-containing protein [Paenibacillus sp. P96]
MERGYLCTVEEAIQRPIFREARVVAGFGGLARPIRWVHILETCDFDTLIHGGEMILTTGMGMQQEGSSPIAFLDSLIQRRAACLCIELGSRLDSIPEDMQGHADLHNFPLIVFAKTIRFVDITLDLHSLLVHLHHKQLQESEVISREFQRLTLMPQSTHKVLQLLHESVGRPIVYAPAEGRVICCPPVDQAQLQQWMGVIPSQEELHNPSEDRSVETVSIVQIAPPSVQNPRELTWAAVKPVGALGQVWAHLAIIGVNQPLPHETRLLDSASLAISQELLRSRTMEERTLFARSSWLEDLLQGNPPDERQLKRLIGPEFEMLHRQPYRVCLLELDDEPLPNSPSGTPELHLNRDYEADGLHLSLVVRSVLERVHFHPVISISHSKLAVLVFDLQSHSAPSKERLELALLSLQKQRPGERLKPLSLTAGISRPHEHLQEAPSACQEAMQALTLYTCYRQPVLFYEDLGVFQLLLNLNDGTTLQTFVQTYLGPIISYDEAKGSELLLTLRVYLDHDGAKQIAARKLFIVRQSLYYRLEKITELLGKDFMQPENRISIQVALRAYQLLYPDKPQNPRRPSSAQG